MTSAIVERSAAMPALAWNSPFHLAQGQTARMKKLRSSEQGSRPSLR
jgi:hypothetical protein